MELEFANVLNQVTYTVQLGDKVVEVTQSKKSKPLEDQVGEGAGNSQGAESETTDINIVDRETTISKRQFSFTSKIKDIRKAAVLAQFQRHYVKDESVSLS